MKKKKLILVMIAILLSVIIAITLFLVFRKDKVTVPISTHTIRPWTKITSEDITYIELDEDLIFDDIILDTDDILDRYTLAQTTIYPKSFFFKGMLEDEGMMKDGAYRYLSNDEVAYELYTNEVKINAQAITSGMNIDLYLTLKDQNTIQSDLLLANALVLNKYDRDGNVLRNNDPVASLAIRIKRSDVNYLNKALAIGDISVIVSSEAYSERDTKLNEESSIIKYLDSDDNATRE